MKGFSREQMQEAIKDSCGNISVIAVRLNCSWATARKYISDDEALRVQYCGENEAMLDKAESIIKSALDDEADKKTQLETAKWILSTKGYSRGYGGSTKKDLIKRNALKPYQEIDLGFTDPDE